MDRDEMSRHRLDNARDGFGHDMWNKDKEVLWKSGVCPYCSEREVISENIIKKSRSSKYPFVGVKYTCNRCGCVNVFTGVQI
jgi:hypothetical protein